MARRAGGARDRFTPEERRKIVVDFRQSDMTRAEAAQKYGISTTTLDKYRREWGDVFDGSGKGIFV